MDNDNLGDWRMDTVAALAERIGDLQAGTPLRLMSVAKHKRHRYLCFATPSPSALCLNTAINAAAMAEGIRPRLELVQTKLSNGCRGFAVRDDSLSDLYYFFEQSIVAVTLSFQALECFANGIIGRRSAGMIRVKQKAGVERELSARDAERELSTEVKLGQVLPDILGVSTPRGNRTWQRFKMLKDARDATVHLKSTDVYTNKQIDRESLFFALLNQEAIEYPAAAIKIIAHYFPSGSPRWLQHARELAERDSRARSPIANSAV